MTPHKETTKEPIGDIILWPTMQSEWSKNSTFQLTFSVFDYDSALYDPLDVESSIVLEGQEYIVKIVLKILILIRKISLPGISTMRLVESINEVTLP